MSAGLAVIGGDDRMHQGDFGDGVRTFTGDEIAKLVAASRGGSLRGVIVLTKWLHGQLKNGLKNLPPTVTVRYYTGSINRLEKEFDDYVASNFPMTLAPARVLTRGLGEALRVVGSRSDGSEIRDYVPVIESAPAPAEEEATVEQEKPYAFQGTPWTKEEDEALLVAHESSKLWKERVEAFYTLTGSRVRTESALMQRHRVILDRAPKKKPKPKAIPEKVSTRNYTAAAFTPPPASKQSARTVQLRSGGELSLSIGVDLFSLTGAERELVFKLIDLMAEYEQKKG